MKADRRGELNGAAKLTVNDVLLIRAMYRRGITYDRIAREFEIHAAHVCAIVMRKSWKHVR